LDLEELHLHRFQFFRKPNTYTERNRLSDSHRYANGYAHGNTNTNRDSDRNAHSYTVRDSNAYTDSWKWREHGQPDTRIDLHFFDRDLYMDLGWRQRLHPGGWQFCEQIRYL
jgi:hypothetical protein